jgi:hypothetical protein
VRGIMIQGRGAMGALGTKSGGNGTKSGGMVQGRGVMGVLPGISSFNAHTHTYARAHARIHTSTHTNAQTSCKVCKPAGER